MLFVVVVVLFVLFFVGFCQFPCTKEKRKNRQGKQSIGRGENDA